MPQFPSTLEKGLNKLMSLKDSFGGMVSQASTAAHMSAHTSAAAHSATCRACMALLPSSCCAVLVVQVAS